MKAGGKQWQLDVACDIFVYGSEFNKGTNGMVRFS